MLGLTQTTQARSTEKLSSGYRINRAADDAAGLSISEKMRKQIRGLTQASANAQDAISAVQTAEGALNEVQDMLQRMNELAVKSANGTNSETDRTAIQNEIDQLVTEIDRVAETTKFNETYLLKGDSAGTKDAKFTYKDTAKITSQDLYYVKNGAVGSIKAGAYTGTIDKIGVDKFFTSKDGVVVAGDKATSAQIGSIALLNAEGLYKKDGNNYVLANKGESYAGSGAYYSVTFGSNGSIATAASATAASATGYKATSTIYDNKGASYAANDVIGSASTNFYKAIGSVSLDPSASVATSDMYTTGMVQFTDKDGNEIAQNGLDKYINKDGKVTGDLYLKAGGESRKATDDDVKELVTIGTQKIGSLKLSLHVGADATDNNQIGLELHAMDAETLGVNGLKVDGTTDVNARDAIEKVKAALQKVSDQRAELGAVQNRLEHTIANLDNVVENTTAAESQIRDTDMATEMVKFSNNNILAQAGQAMLAQANQSNQGVLSLLR